MISSVVLTGKLKEVYKKNYRYVETHNNDSLNANKDIVSLIPVMYWTRDDDNVLFEYPMDTNVIIRGHIETDKEVGLFIVAEILEKR